MIPVSVLQAWLNDDESAELLLALERRAVGYLERQTGRHLGDPKTVTRSFDGRGSQLLFLPEEPRDPAGLVLEVRSEFTSAWELVESDEYEVDGRRVFRVAEVWPRGRFNLRATYDAGYTAADAPQDLRQAVIDLVEHWYRGRVTATPGFVPEEVTQQSPRLPASVYRTIQAWRIPVGVGSAN